MSKVKNAELEESALFIAEKLLAEVETQIDIADFSQMKDVKRINKLIHAYNQLKPYI